MGKNNDNEERWRRGLDAAADHYAGVSQPKDGREVCEGAESREAVQRDELAAMLRGKLRGLSVHESRVVTDAVWAFFREAMKQALADAGMNGDATSGAWGRGEMMEALRMMAVKLVQAPKPRFEAGCFLLAAGIDYPGITSARQWAEAQSLSHQYGAETVEDWQRVMGLPKTSAQKSEHARKVYLDTNGQQSKGEKQHE